MLHQRYVLLIFVAIALLVGVSAQSAFGALVDQFDFLDQRRLEFINDTTILSIVFAVATFVGLIRTMRAITYFDEVVDELFKVTWPTREETLRAATTVVVTTVLIASVIGLYDLMWKKVANVFLFDDGSTVEPTDKT